ncbi:MAG: T9SS type A sorting domain-containing protein [Candidatus Marinimicrobia bacterium]|nr:T9SS type A sorting domain-containing protein [Candidatus Neomarinimicrobiota bacterium]
MKKTCLLIVVVGLILSSFGIAQNLIGNSSFEDQSPSFWSPLNGEFGAAVDVSLTEKHAGFRSFKVSKSAASTDVVGWESVNNATLYWNRIEEATSGGTFALTGWVKTAGVNTNPANDDAKVGLIFEFKNSSGGELATETIWADQSVASKDWENLVGTTVLTEAPASVVVKLVMGKDATGTVYFDNVDCNTTDDWRMGVFNGGAEDVNGWMDWYAGNGSYAVATDAESHTGDYSIVMAQPDTCTALSELVYYSKPYPVEAGEWYKIGVWVKTENVIDSAEYEPSYITKEYFNERVNLCYFFHGDANIETAWDKMPGGDKFVYIDQRDSTTGWTHYVVAEQAPTGEDAATGISVRARFNDKVTGKAYFDDFSVEKIIVDGDNLIGNSSFEDQSPSFWSPLNGEFGAAVDVSLTEKHAGFRSFKVSKSAASTDVVGWESVNNATLYWNRIEEATSGGTFALTGWVKTAGVNTNPANDDAKVGLIFEFKNSSGGELATETIWADQSVASKDWENLVGTTVLTEAPASVVVKLVMGKDATGTVYFDNVDCNTTDDWRMGVFNGGAEDVNGWMDWYAGNGSYAVATDAESHTGDYSIVMAQPDTCTALSELVYYSKPYPVEAGEWYKIGVWVKTENVIDSAEYEPSYITKEYFNERVNLCYFFHGDANIETAWDKMPGGDKFVYIDQRDSTTGWTHYVVAEQAPTGEDAATGISVRARFNDKVTGKAYFDDFSVEKMKVAPGDGIIVDKGQGNNVPHKYAVMDNYPNPFNPETRIVYSLPQSGKVSLTIYNLLGQQVRKLADTVQNAGTYTLTWDARNDFGQNVTTGIYIGVLTIGEQKVTRKMVLVR